MTLITKAGYLRQNPYAALDSEGIPVEVIEINIHGIKYGVRLNDLKEVLNGRYTAKIERIFQNWQQYLGGIAGLARLSRSGKALNIDLVEGGRYTVSLDSLVASLSRRGTYASVGEIPEAVPSWSTGARRLADGQQTIPLQTA